VSHRGRHEALERLAAQAYESVASKKGLMEQVDAHPAVAASCSVDSPWEGGFAKALDTFRPDVDVWAVRLYSALGATTYQVTDPDALRSFLEAEIEKVRNPAKPQSPKVLSKMVAVRLGRVLADSQEKVAAAAKRRENVAQWLKGCLEQADGPLPEWQAKTLDAGQEAAFRADARKRAEEWRKELARVDEPLTEDLRTATRDSLAAWAVRLRTRFPHVCKAYVDLENFLARPDVTDEMVRTACDMVLVEEVMGS
jgi:hypothetical protein